MTIVALVIFLIIGILSYFLMDQIDKRRQDRFSRRRARGREYLEKTKQETADRLREEEEKAQARSADDDYLRRL